MQKKVVSVLSLVFVLFALFASTANAATNDKSRYFTSGITGIQAHMSTLASASLPAQSTNQGFYLEIRPQHSCITALVSLTKTATGGNAHGFYFTDYCTSGGLYVKDIGHDATFRAAYVRVQSYTEPAGSLGSQVISDETVIPRIEKVNATTWKAYLYNFNTGLWDLKLTATGTITSDAYVSAWSQANGTPTACSTLGTYGHYSIWNTKLQRGTGGAYNLAQFSDVDALDNHTMYCTDTTGYPWEFVNSSPADQLVIRV